MEKEEGATKNDDDGRCHFNDPPLDPLKYTLPPGCCHDFFADLASMALMLVLVWLIFVKTFHK